MLMIKPIVCHNCKKEVEELPFRLIWNYKSDKCDQCFNTKNSYHEYEFCSATCMRLWAVKFDGHEHKWDINPIGSGATSKYGRVIDVMTYCTICNEQNYHCKDKTMLEKFIKSHKEYLNLSSKLNKNDNTRRSKKSVHKPKK